MTLTNSWWLLIWLFTGGIALRVFCHQKKEIVCGKKEYRWRVIPAICLLVPYYLWCAGRGNVNDTALYAEIFQSAPDKLSDLSEYISTITKDRGFSILTVLIKCIVGNYRRVYFFVIAAFQLTVVGLICRKYSCDYWFSIFVFVASTDYLSWAQGGIRQFMAATIILAATPFLLKKKYIPTIALILLASTMHQSALLMLPVIFIVQGNAWNRKSVFCILASIIALFFVGEFTDTLETLLSDTQYQNVVSDWTSSSDDGTNIIRVLVYAIPTILSIAGRRYIREENSPIINLSVNMGIISTALYILSYGTSGIYIGRLPIYCSMYSSYILLPWELKNMFTKRSGAIIKGAAIFAYVAFFYYQVFIAW